MSLVGTRPPTQEEVRLYEARHRMRLATKPGITGMWQVNGRSNVLDFEEVVRLDASYINEWSIGHFGGPLMGAFCFIVGSLVAEESLNLNE